MPPCASASACCRRAGSVRPMPKERTPYAETEALLAALGEDALALTRNLVMLDHAELLALRGAAHTLLEAVDAQLHQ